MYQVRYSINITKNDIIRAKKAYKQGAYAMRYIDPIRFEIVEHYLSHFSTEPVNTKDILEQSLVDSIIKQDSYLGMLNSPQVLIPASFDEVCDFIGSIPSDIFGLLIYYSFKYYKKREKKRSINFSKNELLTISNVIHQLLGHQISSDYDVSEYFKNYEKWEKKISINFSRNELLAISNAICQLWLHTSSNYFFDLEAEELVKKIDTYLYENDERSELI